jgi:hypothetical protein
MIRTLLSLPAAARAAAIAGLLAVLLAAPTPTPAFACGDGSCEPPPPPPVGTCPPGLDLAAATGDRAERDANGNGYICVSRERSGQEGPAQDDRL